MTMRSTATIACWHSTQRISTRWRTNARVLNALDRHADALACCDIALSACSGATSVFSMRAAWRCSIWAVSTRRSPPRERALSLDADNGAAHFNLGNALYALGHYDEAEASYRQLDRAGAGSRRSPQKSRRCSAGAGAIRQRAEFLRARDRTRRSKATTRKTNRSLVYLGLGDFKRGWADYHCRFGTADRKNDWRNYPVAALGRQKARWASCWSGASRGSATRSSTPA